MGQKTGSDKGVRGILKQTFKGQISYFTPYFIDYGAGTVWVFLRSKNPFPEILQNQTFGSCKNDLFMSIYGARALLLATPIYLFVFFKILGIT